MNHTFTSRSAHCTNTSAFAVGSCCRIARSRCATAFSFEPCRFQATDMLAARAAPSSRFGAGGLSSITIEETCQGRIRGEERGVGAGRGVGLGKPTGLPS